MKTKTTLPITELRKDLFNILDRIEKTGELYTITENGKPKAVVMSAENFESWQETLEVMKEFPDLPKRIKETERDIKTGKYKEYTTLEELLAREGFVFKDKSAKSYEVSSKAAKRSRKRTK